MNTPDETQMNESSGNSQIIIICSLSIIVLIIGCIYLLGLKEIFKQENSNISSSKSDEKTTDIV